LKNWSLTLGLLGVAAITLLVARSGFDRVVVSVTSVGYSGMALLSGWQLIVAAVLGAAWRAASAVAPGAGLLSRAGSFVWARLVRDATASCLPFSQLGGFALGARVLVLHGQAWATAGASTIGDATAEFLAQIIFAAAALAVLLARRFPHAWPAGWTVPVILLAMATGCVCLPRPTARLCGALAGRIAARGFGLSGPRLRGVEGELQRTYRRVGGFSAANALHVVGWVAKGTGGWIAFRLLGCPIGLIDALAIEALLHAGLTFAVFIPGYVGVQEGGYMLLGVVFGVPPEIALATSLLRRARDVAIGIPVLLAWQFVELRRLRLAR
jgi:putative membrane protein